MLRGFSAIKHLRLVSLGALLFIALVSALNFFALRQLTLGQERSAPVINLSGRQRMLAERIALYATRLVNESSPRLQETYREQLRTSIDEMQSAYLVLINETRSPAVLAVYMEEHMN